MSVILNGKNVPGQIHELLPTVGMRAKKKTYLPDEEGAAAFEGFIGNSPAMEKVKQLAYKALKTKFNFADFFYKNLLTVR